MQRKNPVYQHFRARTVSGIWMLIRTYIGQKTLASTLAKSFRCLRRSCDPQSVNGTTQSLFAGGAPVLCQLSLSQLAVNLEWPIFSQLTHHTIISTKNRLEFSVLKRMTFLEHLHIDASLPNVRPNYAGVASSADIVELLHIHKSDDQSTN